MIKTKKALITGVTGQDGAYLSELLLQKGYEVHGVKRRSSSFNTDRIDHLMGNPHEEKLPFFLHYGDMTDSMNLTRIVEEVQPDEIYNLAAMSHVKVSFDTPEYTANADGTGALRILEAIRLLKMENKTKFYQASTSELYGLVQEVPQSEKTPFYPRSPYAVAKIYAYWITVNYREAYGIFASNGILFNHESPIRGETFVTRKITMAVSKIIVGLQNVLYLGNLGAQRDWGHAKDYVEGMYKILQHNTADDFVLATNKTTTVRDFVKVAFRFVGVEISFSGNDELEQGRVESINSYRMTELNINSSQLKAGDVVLKVDPKYFRPTEVELLIGDPTKANDELGWKSRHSLEDLINDMMLSDLNKVKEDVYLRAGGFSTKNYFE